jgi:hypothetical protein
MHLRYDRWMLPLTVPLGLGPQSSIVEIKGPDLHVKMGWAFDAVIPLASITAATRTDRRVVGWGVHGWGGDWLVNGSSHDVVDLTIDPAVPAQAVKVPIRLHRLRVSVSDPDAPIAACPRA